MNEHMKRLRRWLLADTEHGSKAPCVLKEGSLVKAQWKDDSLYMSYDEAVQAKKALGCSIGFVIREGDGITCVDVDTHPSKDAPEKIDSVRQWAMTLARDAKTYSEYSLSGTGMHIWFLTPNIRPNRAGGLVEVFSGDRFIICTENETPVSTNISDGGEAFKQVLAANPHWLTAAKVNQSKAWMEKANRFLTGEALYTDEEIESRILAHGDELTAIWGGNWKGYYPSQSEADFRLIGYLCYYSKDLAQVERLFAKSGLMREKAHRGDYILRAVGRYAEMVERDGEVDIQAFLDENRVVEPPKKSDVEVTFPDNTFGKLCEFCRTAMPYPNDTLAFIAASGFLAGVCGKAFNVFGTGLNSYILLGGKTGIGKGGVKTAVERILLEVGVGGEFFCADRIASAPAMRKLILARRSVCHFFGEISQRLSALGSGKSSQVDRDLFVELLTLFDVSGANSTLGGIMYSDREKCIAGGTGYAYSIIGEATTDALLGAIDAGMKEDGTLSRFTVMITNADRPAMNDDFRFARMDEDLKDAVFRLINRAANIVFPPADNDALINLEFSNPPEDVKLTEGARDLYKLFDKYCSAKINSCDDNDETMRAIWNRAGLKALRFAAQMACLDQSDREEIVLDEETLGYAIEFFKDNAEKFASYCASGRVGSDDNAMKKAILSAVAKYFSRDVSLVDDDNKP